MQLQTWETSQWGTLHHKGLTSVSKCSAHILKSKTKEQEVKDMWNDFENKTKKQNCHATINNLNVAQTVAMVVVTLSSGEQHFCWPSEVCPWLAFTGGGCLVSETVSICQACSSYDHKALKTWWSSRKPQSGTTYDPLLGCNEEWKKFQWKTCCPQAKRFSFIFFFFFFTNDLKKDERWRIWSNGVMTGLSVWKNSNKRLERTTQLLLLL